MGLWQLNLSYFPIKINIKYYQYYIFSITMYNVHCTVYSVHCILYIVHCTVYSVLDVVQYVSMYIGNRGHSYDKFTFDNGFVLLSLATKVLSPWQPMDGVWLIIYAPPVCYDVHCTMYIIHCILYLLVCSP